MDIIVFSANILSSSGASVTGFLLVAVAVILVLFFLLSKKKKNIPAGIESKDMPVNSPDSVRQLYAPVRGKVIPLRQVPDEAFSSEMMGKGVAIDPSEGAVFAPCDGTISTFFPTGHAIGIVSRDGAEILIHVGIDTVGLNGKGFTPRVKEGDKVSKGQLLLNFDLDYIKSQNLPVITPMIITNSDDYSNLATVDGMDATKDTVVITY